MEQSSQDKALPLGLGLIGLVLVGSLWGCLGFVGEWAGIEAGLPEAVAHRLFRGIGFGTAGLTCALSIWALGKIPSWRSQAAIGVGLYILLLWLTPRSFTYDTGLYHIPLINHLNQIGLEWNLGWLHSRYGFFNLLLYGQSAISRLAGTVALPSLNSLILVGTLLFLAENVSKSSRSLIASFMAVGALLIPSESTEGFHSFNADFSLGCIFLVCCILISETHTSDRNLPLITTGLSTFLPLIKLSGLFLLPFILVGYLKRWDCQRLIQDTKKLAPLIALMTLTTLGFGYITTGYLSYPVAQTGPLRAESIKKEDVIKEAKFSTTAWARFAYSNQLGAIKADATIGDWFPKWSQSQNGKRVLSYTAVNLACAFIGWAIAKENTWTHLLSANAIFWCFIIAAMPPDPRFYFGSVLLTLYGGTQLLNSPREAALYPKRRSKSILLAGIVAISIFTSIWRDGDQAGRDFPEIEYKSQKDFPVNYRSRGGRPVNRAIDGPCWRVPAPCAP